MVQSGSTRGQIAKKTSLATKLVTRSPDESVIHCRGQRSHRCNKGQLLRNAEGHQVWPMSLQSMYMQLQVLYYSL